MIINRLYLGDFGIFQNQLMENVGPGLVVIGGPNRAGKTTLMNAVRYLGFGIPKNASIPAAVKHQINAGVTQDGYSYAVKLEGHAGPKVFLLEESQEGAEVEIAALYGSIDDFSYRQVFTISLDELRQIPEGLSRNEEGKLSAVLLGAGWSDSFKLMDLKEAFSTAAYNIGASKGAVGAKKFKEYKKALDEGISLREQANARLDDYHNRKQRLRVLSEQVQNQDEALEEGKKELQKLDLLERHFERFQNMVQTKAELLKPDSKILLESYPAGGLHEGSMLKDRYGKVLEHYNAAVDAFTSLTGQPVESRLYRGLLTHSSDLVRLEKKLSGWREAVKHLQAKTRELLEKEKALSERIRGVYGEVNKTQALSAVMNVKADVLNIQDLVNKVDTYKGCREQLKAKEYRIKDLEAALQEKTEQKEALPRPDDGLLKKVLWAVGLNVAAVVVLYFLLTPATAVTVGALLGIGILAFFIRQNRKDQWLDVQYRETEKGISDLAFELKSLQKRRNELDNELETIKNEIETLKNRLQIPDQVHVDYLPHFIAEAGTIQKDYRTITVEREDVKSVEQDLSKALSSAAAVLSSTGLLDADDSQGIDDGDVLFPTLETALRYLDAAKDVDHKDAAKKEVEKDIFNLLQKENPDINPELSQQSPGALLEGLIARGQDYGVLVEKEQQCRKAEQFLLEELRGRGWDVRLCEKEGQAAGDDALLQAFGHWCEGFSDKSEIDKQLLKKKEETSRTAQEIEVKKKEIWQVERDLEELAADDKIREASDKIQEARKKLEPLAETYAVHRVAQFMVEQAYHQLLEKTKTELLAPASAIFRKITGGDYAEVEPPRQTSKPEFAVKLSDGKSQEVDKLSRATREQLFLAVRLSRIAAIKPGLPVILDDTLANFDPVHTREAVAFISELSWTHQVFVFTCHPQLVECLHESDSSSVQYWGLDKGTFTGPYDDCTDVTAFLLQKR